LAVLTRGDDRVVSRDASSARKSSARLTVSSTGIPSVCSISYVLARNTIGPPPVHLLSIAP
jgi:hypothetical protein